MKAPPPGAVVECRFLDHCEDGDLLPCIVWGRLTKRSRTSLHITSWESDGTVHNEKRWTIARKAVTSLVVLTAVQ